MQIRSATASDALRLSALAYQSKASWGYDADFMEACRDELAVPMESVGAGRVFVGEDAGEIVGFYALEPISTDEVEVSHLFVAPETIRQGHGRRLFEHLLAEGRRLGYRVVVIQSDPQAAGFYRAMGAREVGVRESVSIAGRMLPLLRIDLD